MANKYTMIYLRTGQLVDLRRGMVRQLCPFIRFVKVGPSTSHLSFTQWVVHTEYPETLKQFIKEYNRLIENPWLEIRVWPAEKAREVGVIGAGFPETVPYEGDGGGLYLQPEEKRDE